MNKYIKYFFFLMKWIIKKLIIVDFNFDIKKKKKLYYDSYQIGA